MIRYVFQPVSHGERSRLWSGRIRLDGWIKARTYSLHVTDKRVAEQKLEKFVQELEREAGGIISPKLVRDAAQTPIADHLKAFLADREAAGRSKNTLRKYGNGIPKLCERCGWVMVRDMTAQSFSAWRAGCGLSPKTVNDMLGAMRSLLNWMERQQLILSNPLKHVLKVENRPPGAFRRALSPDEAQKLIDVAPFHRSVIYLSVLYTGLRRAELNGLTWADFNFGAVPPCLRVPSSISKNRKASVHYLRPELVAALTRFRPKDAAGADSVFRGKLPRVPTFKGDLVRAGIPFENERGRLDFHSLRKTFGTMLGANGVSLQASKALMRHSDVKLTLKVYTDETHLPLVQAMDTLPSFIVPDPPAQLTAQIRDVSSQSKSQAAAKRLDAELSQVVETGVPGHKKASSVSPRRFGEMERAKRLELSTSTLARWCSTN